MGIIWTGCAALGVVLPDPAMVRQRLEEVMSPLGLWTDRVSATFGLVGAMEGA